MAAYQMLRTLEEKVQPQNAALIVVDVQNDFCATGGWIDQLGEDVSQAQAMLPNLQKLIDQARGAGVLVVFVQAVYDERYHSVVYKEFVSRRFQTGLPCQSGTRGVEFYQVQPQPGDFLVQKHRYSAFANTDLDLILRSNGIQTLIMTGVATNGCVESTARDGFFQDYYIVVAEDCCASGNPAFHETALRILADRFGLVVTSKEIIAAWSRVAARPAAR